MNILATRQDQGLDSGIRNLEGWMRSVMGHLGMTPRSFLDSAFSQKIILDVKDCCIKAFLPFPGCKGEDFKVEVTGDLLTVTASCSSCEEKKNKRIFRSERCHETFSESIRLPVTVKAAEATACYKDGVLEILLPREETKKNPIHKVTVK